MSLYDARARAINAEPWQPLPGMVKLRCQHCSYWFATRDADVPCCPDCRIRLRRKQPEFASPTPAKKPIGRAGRANRKLEIITPGPELESTRTW
jgi:hypothetical protein